MKKLSFLALVVVAITMVSGLGIRTSVRAAVGRNTCIISTCHASGAPACARETKLKGQVCSMHAEAADFCVSFIKCGTNKKGQCVVASDKTFQSCKTCVVECLGEGAATDAPLDQRISCQRQCVAAVTPPPPIKIVPLKKTK